MQVKAKMMKEPNSHYAPVLIRVKIGDKTISVPYDASSLTPYEDAVVKCLNNVGYNLQVEDVREEPRRFFFLPSKIFTVTNEDR